MALEGVSIAPNDGTLAPSPTWVRLDGGDDPVTRVASYTIDRGRQFELDTTDGGRADVQINDVDGYLDPTNPGSPLYGAIAPLMQAGIARWNPVLEEWQSRFRGFVSDFDYDFDPSQKVNRLTLQLVDIYHVLESIQMRIGAFGDPPPVAYADHTANIFFDNANVDDRILQIIDNAGLPIEFFVVFSGNVELFETVYSPGESVLTAIQEAVDAEFPGVSNFYPDRFGRGCFHGRLAKFDPIGTAASTSPDRWDFQHWHAGDGTYVNAAPSTRAQIREFAFNLGVSKVFNSASATPPEEPLTAAQIEAQLVEDAASISLRGYHSWSKPNLLTKKGLLDGSTALVETKRFAQYIIDNYAEPRDRVTKVAFRPMHPTDPRAGANWKLLSQIDIGDQIDLTVDSPGGGGFNAEPFFVEGVHEEVSSRLRGATEYDLDNVTLSLDVSPLAYFTSNPFPVG